jgi:hypothetical protein
VFRRPMRLRRPVSAAAACAVLALAAGGCATGRPNGAAREGLDVEIGGLDFNVYITRELNLRDAEDRGYYRGPEAPPGFALYGVFIRVCNMKHGFRTPLSTFVIEDNQGNRFHPVPLPPDNVFAYRPRRLSHKACIPESGSAAADGPTAGALLLYRFPLSALENRPLEMVIQNRAGPTAPPQTKRIELDI